MVMHEDEAMTGQARSWAEEAIGKIVGQLGSAQPASVSVRAMSGFTAEELTSPHTTAIWSW